MVIPSPELIAAWKELTAAQKAAQRTLDARAALPAGSSRARVTTANARWRSAAEARDRALERYRTEIAREAQRLGLLGVR